jgi:hypothetical protein
VTLSNHLDDEQLSAHADNALSPQETAEVQAHIATCSECQERLDGFRAVASLLRRLPEVEPPRDFALGPRLLVDPPNVVRLRRWYTATRAAAGSLAAVFVLLSAGTLYIDSRPATSAPTAEVSKPQVLSAPGDANAGQSAPTPGVAPAAAQRAAVPAASPVAPAPALAPAAGAAARPASPPQSDDQVAATTSVRPLPTQPPTPTPAPTARPISVPAVIPVASAADPAAPLRTGAAVVGVLAVLALLATFIVRHRLVRQAPR